MTIREKAEKLLVKHLVKDYDYPKKLAERHSEILIARWILSGIDKEIDSAIIGEDLYQETLDWETPDYMSENIKRFVKMKLPFPNLDFAETEMDKAIKQEIKNLNF